MVTITVSTQKQFEHKADAYGILLDQDFERKSIKPLDRLFPNLDAIVEHEKFSAAAGDTLTLSLPLKNRAAYAIIVGVGKRDGKAISFEAYRRALARLVRIALSNKCSSLVIMLPSARLFNRTAENIAQETAIIIYLTTYHFDEFITDPKRKQLPTFDVILCTDNKNYESVKHGLETGIIIGKAVNKARHWVDLPPTMLTPPHLADKACEIAKKYDLEITVFDEPTINKMGMGGLAAVSRGSELECRLLIMEYKTKKKDAQTLAFVGKGITFDSGGLSIKPAVHMETMKEDMSGAAAVIAAMEVIAQLKPAINVIVVAPLAENLPSGNAVKPGDIVTFYNGKTAEIKNTDAEGRLILADALSYAVKHYKIDAMVDLATLTGACAYALGPFFAGLMSNHDDLVERIQESADYSGDYVWRLPLTDDYKRAIISDVADLSNTGDSKVMAGAITAGHFLKNFVGDVPWAHLDIAGTAFNNTHVPYYRPGATGYGIRLLVDLAMNWK